MAALSPSSLPSTSQLCDTLPAPRLMTDPLLAHDRPPPQLNTPVIFDGPDNPTLDSPSQEHESLKPAETTPRKLCVRHQRMADEGTNLKLQQSLDAMPLEEREAVNTIWSAFSSSSHRRRALILQGLLTMCCFSQLSLLTEHLAHLIRLDPFVVLPREVALKVLGYLDATSLCRAAQVAKRWRALADDDVLWKSICEQHIGQKCHNCGWGLPRLERKRTFILGANANANASVSPPGSPSFGALSLKRNMSEDEPEMNPPLKRQCSNQGPMPRVELPLSTSLSPPLQFAPTSSSPSPPPPSSTLLTVAPVRVPTTCTRPWKHVYSERMAIECNWRRGRCTVRTLRGHTDGVMCLQFADALAHPVFPVLISGSYDRTVRVWNMDTGTELHCLRGHTRAVRALQFDAVKLVTGSMDHTLKVWDWRGGNCIRTLRGHTDGVVCLNFDESVLVSGSVDTTIKVWNLRRGGGFTLHGHGDWVNAVVLWDANPSTRPEATSVPLFGGRCVGASGSLSPRGCSGSGESGEVDAGKMLFSASDDGTIRLWDLNTRTCLRTMTGHMGQVQSIKILSEGERDDEDGPNAPQPWQPSSASLTVPVPGPVLVPGSLSSNVPSTQNAPDLPLLGARKQPILISGSLDNTIKLWDIESGKAVRTLFGHIEGVWSVACDKLRLVSGSHDRTIKVWSCEEGKCTTTLVGHQAAVSCVALGEDKIVSGSDDSDIKIWSFCP